MSQLNALPSTTLDLDLAQEIRAYGKPGEEAPLFLYVWEGKIDRFDRRIYRVFMLKDGAYHELASTLADGGFQLDYDPWGNHCAASVPSLDDMRIGLQMLDDQIDWTNGKLVRKLDYDARQFSGKWITLPVLIPYTERLLMGKTLDGPHLCHMAVYDLRTHEWLYFTCSVPTTEAVIGENRTSEITNVRTFNGGRAVSVELSGRPGPLLGYLDRYCEFPRSEVLAPSNFNIEFGVDASETIRVTVSVRE